MEKIEEIKIEMETEDLLSFREFLLNNDAMIDIQEIHKMSAGFQREPIIIALVIALGGPAITSELVSLAKEWLNKNAEIKMEKMKITAHLMGGGSRKLTIAELEQFDKMTK